MKCTAAPSVLLRFAMPALALLVVMLPACGSTAEDVILDAPPAPRIPERVHVAEEVGRLLGPDAAVSRAAGRRLMALDGEPRQAFLDYVGELEGERDVRLLDVLDEQHALPEMPLEAQMDFLLWKAGREDRFYAMKARSRLMDIARDNPDAVIARLREGGDGAEVLSVVLAVSGVQRSLPALIERYRLAGSQRERTAAAEALGMLAGDERRPRPSGSPAEIERDAASLSTWYREQLELAAERSSVPPAPESGGSR